MSDAAHTPAEGSSVESPLDEDATPDVTNMMDDGDGDGEVEAEVDAEAEADHEDEDEDDDEVLLLRVPEERELSPEDEEEGLPPERRKPERADSTPVVQGSSAEGSRERTVIVDDDFKERSESATASSAPTPAPSGSAPVATTKKTHKRKLEESGSSPRATPPMPNIDSSNVAIPPLFQPAPAYFAPGFFTTRSHPWNRGGYRYIACGPFEDADSMGGYPIYRTIESTPPGVVKWAWEDRSSYVHISNDGMRVTAEKGFRSARASIPIREGRWYFEVAVERGGGESVPAAGSRTDAAHIRIGLGRRESGLNAPAGIDGFSYALRDKTGDTVHLSKPKRYGEAFGSGDVIGVFVDLPPMREPIPGDTRDPARIVRKRIPIRYRGQLYFESTEVAVSKEMEDLAEAASPTKLKAKPVVVTKKAAPGQKVAPAKPMGPPPRPLGVLEGSKVAYFKNGACQGIAFRNLLDFLPLRPHPKPKNAPRRKTDYEEGSSLARENWHDDGTIGYFPFVSVYGGAVARLNPGPDFSFPPPVDIDAALDRVEPQQDAKQTWRPLNELHAIYMDEQHELDLIDADEARRAYAREEAAQRQQAAQERRRGKPPSPSLASIPLPKKKDAATAKKAPGLADGLRSGSRPGTPLAQEWKPQLEARNGAVAAHKEGKTESGPDEQMETDEGAFTFLPAETEMVNLDFDDRSSSPATAAAAAATQPNLTSSPAPGEERPNGVDHGDVKMETV